MVVIQVLQRATFTKQALAQRLKDYELSADRGTIYDRNGVTLALSTDMDTVSANPYQIKKKMKVAKEIAPILDESPRSIYKKLTKKTGFVYLGRKIAKDKTDRLKKLNIEGLWFSKESKRLYPGADLAAHIIGFVDIDNKGLSGIELYFDKLLKGKPGWVRQEQDQLGRPIPGGENKYIPATNGHELVLTIDKEIQYKAQLELNNAIEEYQAKSGSVIVMDPRSGEIYALASAPNFDLNKFSQVKDSAVFTDHAISDRYEPGSTMKVITGSAALEANIFTPESSFILPGEIRVGGWPIHDSHERGTETFTFKSIITHSSNIGAATIAKKLGKWPLYSYIKKFGLLRPTGIELPGESQGYVPNPKNWSASSLATISFGQ
ncbi:MAG TPA: stage V sporulation protein D, partial [Actinobacteria bacterium]|nr:stage V sporulation protein D [Actinomycetes bacterium]HEX21441.1 stage V sporulation protein D [Actinomycetota bacterium]